MNQNEKFKSLIIELIQKLTKIQLDPNMFQKINFSNLDFQSKTIAAFFYFLNNDEHVNKIFKIFQILDFYSLKKKIIYDLFYECRFLALTDKEKLTLYSIFLFKSLYKISLNTSALSNINSNTAINNFFLLYSQFIIFYTSTKIAERDENEIKKKIFKSLVFIIENDSSVISAIKLKNKSKTIIEYSLNLKSTLIAYLDEFTGFSDKPFSIISIDGQKYLKGDFFTKTYEIFNKNTKSNEKFELKD